MSKPSDAELYDMADDLCVGWLGEFPTGLIPAIQAALTRVRDETAVEVERLRELLDDAFVMSRIEPHKYRKQRADEIRALAAREVKS